MISSLIIFLSAFLPGFWALRKASFEQPRFKFMLTFSGAYILTLLLSHLLPELFHESEFPTTVGLWMVIGLFFQMVLEGFTMGVEHGHVHSIKRKDNASGLFAGFSLLIALSIHALVEGTMLVQPGKWSMSWQGYGILFGLAAHKLPAAIALVMVLRTRLKSSTTLLWLIGFSLMTPIGFFAGSWLNEAGVLEAEGLQILYGLASGSLLYIATTILFEARRDHGFRFKETFPALVGAGVAILLEYFLI